MNQFDRMEKNTGRRKVRAIRRIVLLALLVAAGGLFCQKKQIGPFGASQIERPQVEDQRTPEEAQKDFNELMMEIFREEVADDSITRNFMIKDPSSYGIEKTEASLGHYSVEEFQKSLFIAENWIAALETYDYDKLSEDQQLTYDIVYNMLKQNMEFSDLLEYSECLGPVSGIQAQLPVLLVEYHFYRQSDVEEYLSLLNMLPEYFQEIISFEQQKSEKGLFMNDTTAQAIIEQCKAFIQTPEKNYLISTFDSRLSQLELSEEEKKKYIEDNRKAVLEKIIPAYQSLIDALKQLKGTGKNKNGLCGLEKGKQYYEYLIRVETGSDRSIREIGQMLDDAIQKEKTEMAQIMTESPEAYYAAQKAEYSDSNPEKAIKQLKQDINGDFPALNDNIECQVKYVDESMEDSMSPAFYLSPPIDDYQKNVMYINQSERFDLSKSFATIAHESYPGHLYQTCYFQSQNPCPVRSIISIGGYSEGWGTYAELYSYQLAGLDSDVAKLLSANTLLTLCIYAKADLEINYGGWDFEELKNYLADFGYDKSTSRVIFDTIVAEPASYMQYTLGYLEIDSLLSEAREKLGDQFELKAFHEFYLSTGTAPFAILQDRLDDWIREQRKKAETQK